MSPDGTTILFGLPGVRVREVVRAADGARTVHVLTEEESATACPVCGVFSTSVRQRRTTRPRDLRYGEAALVVRWHKTQYFSPGAALPAEGVHRGHPGGAGWRPTYRPVAPPRRRAGG